MITQYSQPEEIDREFWEDVNRAKYWLKKHTSSRRQTLKLMDDGGYDVFECKRKYCYSEPVFYTSPTTGNKWLTYLYSTYRDGFSMYIRTILYQYTERYMTMMVPIMMVEMDDDGNKLSERVGVNVYTAHLFQRMADPDRLGVDMTDRVKVMRNFLEFVATGWSDYRPPREGEQYTQVILRTPGSWIRGHTVQVGERFVNIYRTFYTDRSLSYKQMRDVRTFRKFADRKMINQ